MRVSTFHFRISGFLAASECNWVSFWSCHQQQHFDCWLVFSSSPSCAQKVTLFYPSLRPRPWLHQKSPVRRYQKSCGRCKKNDVITSQSPQESESRIDAGLVLPIDRHLLPLLPRPRQDVQPLSLVSAANRGLHVAGLSFSVQKWKKFCCTKKKNPAKNTSRPRRESSWDLLNSW